MIMFAGYIFPHSALLCLLTTENVSAAPCVVLCELHDGCHYTVMSFFTFCISFLCALPVFPVRTFWLQDLQISIFSLTLSIIVPVTIQMPNA